MYVYFRILRCLDLKYNHNISPYLYFSALGEIDDSSSYNTLMKVDTTKDEENKENYNYHNLENKYKTSGEGDREEGVDISNIKEHKDSDCHTSFLQPSSDITKGTTTKIYDEKVIQVENIVKNLSCNSDTSENTSDKEEEKLILSAISDDDQHTNVEQADAKHDCTSNEKSQDVAHNLQHLDDCGNVIIDKVKALEFEIKESENKIVSSNTTDVIVPIIKRSPSDISEGSHKVSLKNENSEPSLDPFSESALKNPKSSPNQRNHTNRSSTHRVKFKEELPTKSTLQFNPASILSSSSENSYSIMGGASIDATTTPGHNKEFGEQSSLQIKTDSDHQELSENFQSGPPHVMITEEFPSRESNAFGTRIDR